MPNILVVDDDQVTARMIADRLREDRYEVRVALTAEEGLKMVGELLPDAVFLDVVLPGMDGIKLLKALKAERPALPIVMLTARQDVSTAVEAMRAGADDYLTKPEIPDKLLVAARNAVKMADLARQVRALKTQLEERQPAVMVGSSAAMRRLSESVRKASAGDITVLLLGESGTGKEVAARAIHAASRRADEPFVAIDCAMLPETLTESELFGYERGAFTGAVARKPGRMEQAHGGTLFLDEIGNLTLPVQQKLLRFLEERRIERLGGKDSFRVDVRLIAATNADLDAAVKGKAFREDLFYRLNVLSITVPPLRDRRGDVPELARHFLARFAGEQHKLPPKIAREAAEALEAYHWPGNVRELRNVMERAVLLAEDEIGLEHLPPQFQELGEDGAGGREAGLKGAGRKASADTERAMIVEALERFRWNKTKVSAFLKVDYKTLYNKMKAYRIPLRP